LGLEDPRDPRDPRLIFRRSASPRLGLEDPRDPRDPRLILKIRVIGVIRV